MSILRPAALLIPVAIFILVAPGCGISQEDLDATVADLNIRIGQVENSIDDRLEDNEGTMAQLLVDVGDANAQALGASQEQVQQMYEYYESLDTQVNEYGHLARELNNLRETNRQFYGDLYHILLRFHDLMAFQMGAVEAERDNLRYMVRALANLLEELEPHIPEGAADGAGTEGGDTQD